MPRKINPLQKNVIVLREISFAKTPIEYQERASQKGLDEYAGLAMKMKEILENAIIVESGKI